MAANVTRGPNPQSAPTGGGILPPTNPTHAPGMLPVAKPMAPQLTPPKPAGQIPIQHPQQPKPQQIKVPSVRTMPTAQPNIKTAKTAQRKG